jgi:serine/threonine-protein kinase HipA
MFRLAVFNVIAHNRDDHGKNFTYLMNAKGEWRLSPAYDLTFSSGSGAEQTTTVMGQGKAPSIADLKKLGGFAGLSMADVQAIIGSTRDAVCEWPELAAQHGVTKPQIKLIGSRLAGLS